MDATLLAIFATSLVVGYSGALMPGPLLTVAVSESARRGFRAGPLLVAGHGAAEVLLLAGLAIGLSPLLDLGYVRTGIAVLGGLVLLWMGSCTVRAAGRGQISLEVTAGRASPTNRHVLTGALVSVSNPYWIIWWATVGATYVAWARTAGPLGLFAFYIGHILSDFTWYGFVSAVVAGSGRLMNDVAYRAVLTICGAFLVALGGYFIVSGIWN